MTVDLSAALCGQCHIRGSFPTYEIGHPESFNYTPGEQPHKHHQQYRDWRISKHSKALEDLKNSSHAQDYCLKCRSADYIRNPEITLEEAKLSVTYVNCHNPHTLELWIPNEPNKKVDVTAVCGQYHTAGGYVEEEQGEMVQYTIRNIQ